MLKYINKLIKIFIVILFSLLITKYLKVIKPFKINHIDIEGNNYISKNIIKNKIKDQINNKSILNVDFETIKKILNNDNYIYKTKIYTKIPSTILINISEIEPIGLLEKNDSTFFLDQDLNFINADYRAINYFSNTPVITNLNNQELDLLKIKDISQQIIKNNKIYNQLNEIRLQEEKIILIVNNNTKIILSNNKYKTSIKYFLQFNNDIIKNQKIEQYKYIDVSIPNQIVIKENEIKI